MPVPHAGSLMLLGAPRKAGIKRRMLIEGAPALTSVIAANIVLANQTVSNPYDLGHKYCISRMGPPLWEHDTHTHYQLQCEQFIRDRNTDNASPSAVPPPTVRRNTSQPIPTTQAAHTNPVAPHVPAPAVATVAPAPPLPTHSRRRPRQGPCVNGHPTTSLVDPRGNPRWNMAPTKAPLWEGVQPGSTLCQRCFEHYRTAHLRGTVPTVPATPRLLILPPTPLAVPSTPTPTPIHNTHARPPG